MKRSIGTLLLVCLMVSSGCLGFITGQEPLTITAGQATVSDQALSETGYEKTRATEQVIERSFAGRKVKVTNHLVEYKRQVTIPVLGTQEFARFTVLATPKVTVAGKEFNPVSHLSNRELVQQLQKKYDTIQNVQLVGNRSVQVLGSGVRVSKFTAKATMANGQSVDVFLHVAQAETDHDFVIAIAVYPQSLEGEQQRVNTLLKGIQHQPPQEN